MKIYVTVCRDRHAEDEIKVHSTLRKANAFLNEFKKEYDSSSHKWKEQEVEGWVRYITSHDDGPSAYIEVSKLL